MCDSLDVETLAKGLSDNNFSEVKEKGGFSPAHTSYPINAACFD